MKLSWEYLAAGAGTVVTLLLAWFIGPWAHLQGMNSLILRLGVLIFGLLCVGGFLVRSRSKPAKPESPSTSGVAQPTASDVAPDDIDRLVREAERKVSSSRLGHGATLGDLPTIFVLGETSVGKTTVLLNCGLDPELLAGQIYQEGNVVPTPAANFWFARKLIFVEAAGKLSADGKLWVRIISRLAPRRFSSIFSSRRQQPRAALVCLSCEQLAKAGSGSDALASSARTLRARLEEMSHEFGISFPVYVLFCKLDQVSYFADFADTLKDEEITHVLGATLPAAMSSGVYAEQETRRLSGAFQSLFYSLADCRPGLLVRERDTTKQPGVYEFPRQFRRLSKPAVQFLVELCRPSHLTAGPFLRGFYFVGRRMVASSGASAAALAAQTTIRSSADYSTSATTILRAEDMPATAQHGTETAVQNPSESRLVPQWVFLSHIFSHVLLQDRAALGTSGASTKGNIGRRLLFGSLAAICAVVIAGFVISFLSNYALETRVESAARNIQLSSQPGTELASLQDWEALDALREPLQILGGYERNNPPLHMRWGLYVGNDLYAQARSTYFARFRQLLFDQTFGELHSVLLRLPASPGPTEDYSSAYVPLKAYLIITDHPEKATRQFLTPTLTKYWLAGRDLDNERKQLAQSQLDFYTDELQIANPYSIDADSFAVSHARSYLRQFEAAQRIYHAMLADALKQDPSLNFNQKYPEADPVVRAPQEVAGAFTRSGWNFMEDAFRHLDRYVSGEQWVLGNQAGEAASSVTLERDLRALYVKDYIQAWRDFLNAATVLHSANYAEEAGKLQILSGNRSPLLMLLCEVSQNVPADATEVRKALAPPQQTVPAPCQDKVVQSPNQNYVAALNAAATCLQGIQALPAEQRDDAVTQCNAASGQAHAAADQIAQTFTIDQEGKLDQTVKRLLEAPTAAAPPPPAPGPAGLSEMCTTLKVLGAKYPFNPGTAQEAAFSDFTAFFQPEVGILSKFLDRNRDFFEPQGSQYVQKSNKSNPALLDTINKAVDIQRALYPSGSASLRFKFIVRIHVKPEIKSEVLTIDGQDLDLHSDEQGSKTFVWSGSSGEASLLLNDLQFGQGSGPWAPFKFFGGYSWTLGSSGYHLMWRARGMQGQTVTVPELYLEAGSVPLFQRGYLSTLKCPAY